MAVASYNTDLSVSNSGEVAAGNITTDSGTWDESTNASWDDGGAPAEETNKYINYSQCVSAQFTKAGQGTIMYDHTSDVTVDTDGAVLIWSFFDSPPSLSAFAAGGVKILAGEDFGNFHAWDCGGNDFEPSPIGGWYCYALNPSIGSPDDQVGTVSFPGSMFGIAINASAQARGYPLAVNSIRVGRCTLEVTAGDATAYGTFAGMNTFDTSTNVRYGLFINQGGAYRWQGLMSLGTAAAAVDFRDSTGASIAVANTPNVSANFNRIEIRNSSSNVEIEGLSITCPGKNNTVAATASKGDLVVVDNATVKLTGCSFKDMNTFTFNDGTNSNDILSTKFITCGAITQGGATFTACEFNKPESPIVVDALNVITKCTFIGASTPGHAINLGSISSNTSVNWDNTIDSGTTDWIGSSGNTAGPSGDSNDCILCNVSSGITLTINVSDTATVPTVQNTGSGNVNIVAGQKTFSFTLNPSITGYEWRIYDVNATGSLTGAVELDGEETATVDNQSYSYSYVADDVIAVQIMSSNYEESITYYTLGNSDQSVTINLTLEDNA